MSVYVEFRQITAEKTLLFYGWWPYAPPQVILLVDCIMHFHWIKPRKLYYRLECCPNLALAHFLLRERAGAAAALACAVDVWWVCLAC